MNARIPSLVGRTTKQPRSHQLEALAGIHDALAIADRTKVIQACGTGKTLTALWAVEQTQARTALVLVPTLALMSQTFREWRSENGFPNGFRHICVCSDASVDADDVTFDEAERLEYRSCTDAVTVRAFLEGAGAPYSEAPLSVIFSTYQSAAVVGDAIRGREGQQTLSPIDIAILDEAHKTVGPFGKRNGFALHDENLPIRKRIFFTATERLVEQSRAADDFGDARVLSMDNEQLYGRTAYQLGFMQAASRGLIAPFQVIGSFVNDAMLSAHELAAPDAKQIADIRSLQHAMRKVNARKAITFHHRIRDAQDFAAGFHNVPTFHVNGKQKAAEREAVMAAFAAAPEGIMTNAQCLTEGIDVPSVDMVAFMDPRQSSTDIVQIAGRSMRLSPGKGLGYVFVPLHVDVAGGETVEQAIARGDFRQIMTVLQSLTENDGVPTPWLTRMHEALEPGDRAGGSPLLRLFSEGSSDVDVERIVAALSARILHFCKPHFDAEIARLRAFRDEHGHCNVPVKHPGGLGRWVSRQRMAAKRSNYPERHRAQLDAMGFVWNLRDVLRETEWTTRIRQLKAFHLGHGHCNVPNEYADGLGGWVSRQRMASRWPDYPADRRTQLDAMGFTWDLRGSEWGTRIEQLTAFKSEHGHCNVPVKYPGGLGAWVHIQRRDAKGPDYPGERRAQLDRMGFVWSAVDRWWAIRIEQLAAFQREHGHCNVPVTYPGGLGRWVSNQRDAAKHASYPEERRAQLNALRFAWSVRRSAVADSTVHKPSVDQTEIVRGQHPHGPVDDVEEVSVQQLKQKQHEIRPWAGVERITLAPLVELRLKRRKAQGLPQETSRQMNALLVGQFARLKDMEFIRIDELDAECHAQLLELASAFSGVAISVDIDHEPLEEEEEGSDRPRG